MDYTKEDVETLDFGNITCSVSAAADTTYLSSIDLSSLTINALGPNVSPNIYVNGSTVSPTWTNQASGKIMLEGPNADIEVNGQSLMAMLSKIEQRLNILQPNPGLEAEWDQLRELGEQYRALEKKLQEQSDMWNTLKKMPPPEIT